MSRPALQRFAACWGNGDFGRLGHGPNCSPEWVPRVVAALADMNISAVEAGGAHTAVLAGALSLCNAKLIAQCKGGQNSASRCVWLAANLFSSGSDHDKSGC